MTATKIKRSQVQTFLNTTPLSAATYSLIGDGVKSGKIAYNAKVTDETYIHQDSATITIDSYAPKIAVSATAKFGDVVFNFLDGLRINRSILDAAETDIINVWMYKTGGPTAYPAEKQAVSISIEDFGGDGGDAVQLSYSLNFISDPILGTFNATTKAFTPS
jgi:hypothetical protein